MKTTDAIASCDPCYIENSHSKNGDSNNFIEELISFCDHFFHTLEQTVKGVEDVVDSGRDGLDGGESFLQQFDFHY